MTNRLDERRFGDLIAIERVANKKNATMYHCRCDCGSQFVTYSTHLLRGKVTNCGCKHGKPGSLHPRWTGFGEISGNQWYSIQRGKISKRKNRSGHEFDITIEYAWNLFIKQERKCSLSGLCLIFSKKTKSTDTTASLDRIDSSIGYIEGNVQWVHKDINRMKNIYPEEYFVNMCKLIAENRK